MSAPQLTDANTSSQWLRTVAEQGTGPQRSPSQAAIDVTQRRKRFVRLVTYMMVGLVAFTLLGVASFAWRRHSMRAALDAPVALAPVPAVVAAAAPIAATPPASQANSEPVAARAAPVAAAVPRVVPKKAPAVVKSKPASKSGARTSPFLGAKPATKARAK